MNVDKIQSIVNYKNVFFFATIIFALSLPLSESFISIFSGVILLVSFLFFCRNSSNWKDSRIWALVSVFFIFVLGLLHSRDLKLGLYEINKNLFWLVIPLGVGLSPRISSKKFWMILVAFLVAVTASSFISVLRNIFSNGTIALNFREVNYVSHISLSFQVTFSILVLLYSFQFRTEIVSGIHPFLRMIWIAWLLFFLFILKSVVGWFAFYTTILFVLSHVIVSANQQILRKSLSIFLVVFILLPIGYVGEIVRDFYTVRYKMEDANEKYTPKGNKYSFDFNDTQKENGYYVSWFLCHSELYEEWNKRSNIPLTTLDSNGFSLESTLIRYLASKGLKKDAEGVKQLADMDIKNIENGIANYRYVKSKFSIYPRIYETIWEYDRYRLTGDANNQSFSQRIEYAKAAILIIKKNFFFGIGTGSYKLAYSEMFQEMKTKLKSENYGVAHNQFLSYFLKFGLLGFLFITSVLSYVFFANRTGKNILLIAFLFNLIIGNLGESVFETHVGLSYFLFFFALFIWHSPDYMSDKKEIRQV